MEFPRCLDVEVTASCNQGCQYCFLGKSLPGSKMTQETASLVVDFLGQCAERHRVVELNLYGGEPFLNWPICQFLVREVERRDIPCRFTIFTNGATATEEQIAWCRIRRILPKRSTAGCPEAATSSRPGRYTERWLQEGRLWEDYDQPRRLTVTPANAPYAFRSVAWLHQNGFYGPVDFSTDDYAPWPQEAAQAFQDGLKRLADEVVAQWRIGKVLAIENFQNHARGEFGQGDVMVLGCGAGANTIGISWDGHAKLCHRALREGPESILSGGHLRDIVRGQQLKFGPQVAEQIERFKTGQELPECKVCPARKSCNHGCMHISYKAGDGALNHQPDQRCESIRAYVRWTTVIHEALAGQDPRWYARAATPCEIKE